MKRFILYIFIAFALLGCGGSEGRFRLKGKFEHLQQGEFYLYSNDGGTVRFDTINVLGGNFDYETELVGEATFVLLYPNLSELVIFAASGDMITVKGDARNLRAVEVKGSKPNEDLTAFRLAQAGKSAAEIRKAAAEFINRSPASPVSAFLFRQHFLLPGGVPPEEIKEHYRVLCQAQPDNLRLIQWKDDVERLSAGLEKGDSVPDFFLKLPDGEEVTAAGCRGKYLLMNFWASWESSSSALMFRLKWLQRNYAVDSLRVVSVSLDINESAKKGVERVDSVTWASFCDYQAWNSPVVKQFAVPYIPYCLLAGPDGRILAIGSYEKDVLPEVEKLFKRL